MWKRTHSVVTKEISKEQIWKLFSDVNHWNTWDEGIEYTEMNGDFVKGTTFILKPKGGPKVKVELLETIENRKFVDVTHFPLAKMYDEHEFEETADGLKITNTISVKGILSFFWIKVVAQNIADAMPGDVKNQIKSAAKL
ncbi:Polyketide cyclase / dehydrase and lipid transport [Pseudarcicella hirudinis]|uniref:Polyketide cyclase / dehydrase and lipid transport n=1 Tax=Pseudarcicella hirudinis TaxID=1079859 RepID=A0A1I5RGS2_9BACT|nr:SRPBCC family protein [Pseudarcicella hirudinis]SFP57715.1 Polyketide cyclase / dehydrase and lipid transport [Pseudarcicella hirudinis]